jgi:hypothetical protein
MNMSMIPPSELGDRSPIAPGTSKKSAVKTSKAQKKLVVGSQGESAEEAPISSKETESSAVRKKSTPLSVKAASKSQSKSVIAPKKAKGKSIEKSAVTCSSPDEKSLVESATHAEKGSAIPIEKGSAAPIPLSTMYDRTRSKRKAVVEQAKSKVNIYFFHILYHCLLHTC